jgi:hypothetical protein
MQNLKNILVLSFVLFLNTQINAQEKETTYHLSHSVTKMETVKKVYKDLKKIEQFDFYTLKVNLLNYRKVSVNRLVYLKNYKKFNNYLKNNDLKNARILIKNLYILNI